MNNFYPRQSIHPKHLTAEVYLTHICKYDKFLFLQFGMGPRDLPPGRHLDRVEQVLSQVIKILSTKLLPVGMFFNKFMIFEFAVVDSPLLDIREELRSFDAINRGDIEYVFYNNKTKKDHIEFLYQGLVHTKAVSPRRSPCYLSIHNLNVKIFPGKRPQDLLNYNNITLLDSAFKIKTLK